jgi:DNA-binding transcriptional regulator YiaG
MSTSGGPHWLSPLRLLLFMRTSDLLLLAWAREAATTGEAERLRTSARLERTEVAEVCGVSDDAVRLWERGERQPRGEAALRYARLLDRLRSEMPQPS